MKIILADDHVMVRSGVFRILQEAFPTSQIAEAGNTTELLELVKQESWDLVISDISMPPGDSGLDAIKKIKQLSPKTAVIIMSMHAPELYAVRAIKSGAAGYLSKDMASVELVKAIEQVISGRRYMSPEVATILADAVGSAHEERSLDILSEREREVFRLLVQGHAITDIAKALSLNANTISTFRARILEKMGFHNNMELIRYAVDNGLV
jgi:two-component system invasion response regulator UvrY